MNNSEKEIALNRIREMDEKDKEIKRLKALSTKYINLFDSLMHELYKLPIPVCSLLQEIRAKYINLRNQ